MKNNKYWGLIGILAVFALIIHFFSVNSLLVEDYYSIGIYPYIGAFSRYLLGWIPFSVGDILYGAAFFWLLFTIVRAIIALFKKKLFYNGLLTTVQRILVFLLVIYLFFNVNWGINYNRKGISSQLGLPMEKYSVSELTTLNTVLLQKINASKTLLLLNRDTLTSSGEIFHKSLQAYEDVTKAYPFLNYHPPSIKSSLWGWLGNYLGFMGYYNPFTGEGQVNTTIPAFLQPYTTCHEIAHQLGYAKENEANFVGYLAAAASKEASFHYSVYLDLFCTPTVTCSKRIHWPLTP